MARKDKTENNTIGGNVVGSNIQTGDSGVTINGVNYPDGVPADSDVINGRIVRRG